MLNPEEIRTVTGHGAFHEMGLCICPCYDAIVKVAQALDKEMAMRAKVAQASPELLAALTISANEVLEAHREKT